MSLQDIDDFLQKTTILQQTISGIADGSLDGDKVDLTEYGILTPEQQIEEENRRIKAKKELERKEVERKRVEEEHDKQLWWDGAVSVYGPRDDVGLAEKPIHDRDKNGDDDDDVRKIIGM